MATCRETARDAIVTLLTAALVGPGLPVKTVTGSKVSNLEGVTPLVVVLSKASARDLSFGHGNVAAFAFSVQVWVLQSGAGWTHAQAEDALDCIEARIAQVYEDNLVNRTTWEVLAYDGATEVREVAVAGVPYYVETIPTVTKLTTN